MADRWHCWGCIQAIGEGHDYGCEGAPIPKDEIAALKARCEALSEALRELLNGYPHSPFGDRCRALLGAPISVADLGRILKEEQKSRKP